MNSVLEIEKAIEQLPQNQIFQLLEKLEKKANDAWDEQFKHDVRSGKLDSIAQQALAEHRIGKSKTFPHA